MLKKVFYSLSIIGAIVICILAFKIPKDPYEMIPSATMFWDKPLWLCLIISGNFFYFLLLGLIYSRIQMYLDD